MQDFFSRYKLSMLTMYTYHTMIHYTVGFSINVHLFICLFVCHDSLDESEWTRVLKKSCILLFRSVSILLIFTVSLSYCHRSIL